MNRESPSTLPPNHASTRRTVLVVAALLAAGWALLFRDTLDLPQANLDDVSYHRAAVAGRLFDFLHTGFANQGRYYGAVVYLPHALLESLPNPWLYQAVRLGLVALSLGLLGRLVVRITRAPDLVLAWLLVWIAVLQIPPTFYGLLSYPAFHCGLALMALALTRFWSALTESSSPAVSWSAGLLFFLGLQFSEAFIVFALPFLLLVVVRVPLSQPRGVLRLLLPVATAIAAYACIYVAFRVLHRTAYEGTAAGGSLAHAFVYLVRYSASSLPAFELFIDRDAAHSAFINGAEALQRLQALDPWRVPWVVGAGVATAWLVRRTNWSPDRGRAPVLATGAFLTGLAFLALPGISAKYQVYAYRRAYPHVYNFIFVHFLWLAVVLLVFGLAARMPRDSAPRLALAVATGVLVVASGLVAQATNPLALEQIRGIVANPP
jgi:hypothetical protein